MEDVTSPLQVASFNGYDNVVQLLLRQKVDVKLYRKNGDGPLFIACQNEHCTTAQLLMSKVKGVNNIMEDGTSPPYVETLCGYNDIVQLLPCEKANVHLYRKN